MIVKSFEVNKFNFDNYPITLFYGKNDGFQNQILKEKFTNNFKGIISKYEEIEFINNYQTIVAEILTRSLFEDKKLIIISRVSDKITKLIEEIKKERLEDIKIILKAGILEKKSKLRSLFEKDKTLITIPFYDDDAKALTSLVIEFINKNNIKLSRESINLIINRACGNRENLKVELEKIFNFSLSNKNISFENIQKLSNLAENYSVSELADNYLSKNKKSLSKILNENNYSNEDCILILRTLLSKSKRLMEIIERYKENRNLDQVISNTRPPIFWKDKEMVKTQVNNWKLKDLKNKIYEIGNIEILAKSDANNSLNIVSDFVINV